MLVYNIFKYILDEVFKYTQSYLNTCWMKSLNMLEAVFEYNSSSI